MRPHVLDQWHIPVGAVSDKFRHQPQLQANHGNQVCSESDLNIVLPRATPHALERIGVYRPLNRTNLHIDLVDLEPCKVLMSIRKPNWRNQARESGQYSRNLVDMGAPSHQDVHVPGGKLNALCKSGGGAS